MVTITESDVVSQVRINLDEIADNDSNFSVEDKDEKELDTIIKQKMLEAYLYVLSNAKLEFLDETQVSKADAVQISGTTKASATLSDFLRFVWANASVWPYPVYNPIFWNQPEYAELSVTQTTGTSERPKVGISQSFDSNSRTVVTLYGCNNGGAIGYIKKIDSIDSNTKLTSTLYTAYLYYVTALVLLTLRESQHAENMMGQALAIMKIDTSQKTK